MEIKIVDTTLRDGEQRAGIALSLDAKVKIAQILDRIGIYQIEAGIPVMGGDEKKSIKKIAALGLGSKISAWNRMNIGDIRHSIECGVEIVHISVPSSDIQIKTKLKKDKAWVMDNLRKCIDFTREKGFKVTIGLEDASRADFGFLLKVITGAAKEGAQQFRYADTVGILDRQRVLTEIIEIRKQTGAEVEIHTHNDLGMAVSNSIAAAKAGAQYVDCTIGGLGERAGNCDYAKFIKAARGCLGIFKEASLESIIDGQNEILKIMKAV